MRMEVAVDPLRQAFAASDLSVREVARRAGYDWSHVNRILTGSPQYVYRVRADGSRKRYTSVRHSIAYETATRIAEAMNLDPVDVGL